ncbi:MAG TPA: RNA 2',3'-cyclic phosphodiesterase [Leptospiraceae bacterium]|nr:RNA 2',3'-cyclic phosphodiesterase [Leptospiraceae bacterium]HMZ59658.1 RNA 2',3'-cyclic phosphodiesterase [Leptospiraceae bacterium]HNF24231.1 RNA 2',3'-cyclic phosphodiesterase [Leptospiraceae bacterium]HNH07454.1 RNA 2',3'-cyclic phosphodiesterase [Leptospiraceae bacterium]HNN02351.1 RNA 2',3'-cyclic phosphodiesterase [Leptospiraceae bacterium]
MRIFFAVFPPSEIQEQAERLQIGLPNTRWEPLENLHITLLFLGEIPSSKLENIAESAHSLSLSQFFISFRSVRVFRNSRDSVLWTEAVPSDSLERLNLELKKISSSLGVIVQEKEFTPHMTLGRIKKFNESKFLEYAGLFCDFKTEEFSVNQFCLVSSVLNPSGSKYRILETFSLA